jgi:1-deoxy-D-xylulose-5-phosphate reductoisomerase
MSPRGIAILGSTGSIGCNTLRVIEALGPDRFRVVALGAGRNVEILTQQIARHQPDLVSLDTAEAGAQLQTELARQNLPVPRLVFGEAGLVEIARHPKADCVVSATVGAVGFVPTLRALEAGKRVALANKETLVMAGRTDDARRREIGR